MRYRQVSRIARLAVLLLRRDSHSLSNLVRLRDSHSSSALLRDSHRDSLDHSSLVLHKDSMQILIHQDLQCSSIREDRLHRELREIIQ